MNTNVDAKLWAQRTLVVTASGALVVVAFFAVGRLANVLLLFFAGAVLAALLRAIATFLARHTHVPIGVALAITVLLVLGLISGVGMLLVPRVSAQMSELAGQFSRVRDHAVQVFRQQAWMRSALEELRGAGTQGALSRTLGIFSNTLGAIGSFIAIIFVGLYFAISPGVYLDGALRLVPVHGRERAREIAVEAGTTLQHWVLGRLASCTIVGLGTTGGLWAAGTPLALSLGLIAAVLSFIPNFGPVLAVVPAIVVSLPHGVTQVAIVAAIYVGVQALESFVITPQIQQRTVEVPPVLLLLGQTVMGVVTGVLGVLLATPLLACLMLLVKRLYIEGTLERDAPS